MAQLRAKQIKLTKPGDMIIGDAHSNGSILTMGTTAGQALVVKNTGTVKDPVLGLAYDSVAGAFVTYDDTTTKLGATTVQDAIAKLKGSVGGLTGALVYTGTVDASAPKFTPALSSIVATGTYYQVSTAGNKIPTNSTGGLTTPYEWVSVGDAVVWNGTYWNVIAHIDTVVAGTAGTISVTGSPNEGYKATIDPAYIGQTSITTLGTVTTGTWKGTDIDLAHGGTNTDLSTVADNSVIFKSGTGVEVTTPPSGAATPAGAITSFTSTVSDKNTLDADPNTTLSVVSNSAHGKGATVTATTTKSSLYTIHGVTINEAGSGYKTGDTVTLTGFPAGTVKVENVNGHGGIISLDASNLQGAYTSSTDTSATSIMQASTSGEGKGATFHVTESGTTRFTVTGFNVTAPGAGYAIGDKFTVKATIDVSPVILGTVDVKEVSAGSTGAGTTYLSFNPKTTKFSWVDAHDITSTAKQLVEITDQFEFVTGAVGVGQTAAGANAIVTLTHLPVAGSLEVFINGLRLGAADFTYAVSSAGATKGTITLVDSSLGYSAEKGDVIEISYEYVAS